MKCLFIICFSFVSFVACHTNKRIADTIPATQQFFPIDSLKGINFFDFYGKTLEELLRNEIINQYHGYITYAVPKEFDHLQLHYKDNSRSRALKIKTSIGKMILLIERGLKP